ncbi:hypothetical protein [Vreelandella zhaodongensis]|uniref:hypothetical protein n=1 Tax=Vreelandella zhaodongensis TaxID=1176240 RepID=UPI003EBBDAD1
MLSREIHNSRFITRGNPHGRSGADTVFEYAVAEADLITGTYSGGDIRSGQIVGKITGADAIELRFQCITTTGELLSGLSQGRVSRDPAGLLCLDFEWAWLSSNQGGGTSSYVELPAITITSAAQQTNAADR